MRFESGEGDRGFSIFLERIQEDGG